MGLGNPAVAGCGLSIRPIARLLFLTGGSSAFPAPQGREPAVAGERRIQAGLAILGAFARAVDTRQAIVRIERGQLAATPFRPRPSAADWNREHALSRSLHMTKHRRITNEMRGPGGPRVSTQFCGLINLNSPTA